MSNAFRVRLGNQNQIKVVSSNIASNTIGGIPVDVSGIKDNFVLQYDSSVQKFVAVDPDSILVDAAVDTSGIPSNFGSGLPGQFINALDTDTSRTDNVDFDGGDF